MKVEINEQPKKFHLAFKNQWMPAVGHEMSIGKYKFSVVATPKATIFSDVTSGVKVMVFPVNILVHMITSTKEDTMEYYRVIGEKVKERIEKTSHFDSELEKMRKMSLDQLGEMPPIEDVDEGMILADKSDIVH